MNAAQHILLLALPGHELKDCEGTPDGKKVEAEKSAEDVKFIFVRLFVLREYLQKELVMENLPFQYDLERCIDDWVFMCFFVGVYTIDDHLLNFIC